MEGFSERLMNLRVSKEWPIFGLAQTLLGSEEEFWFMELRSAGTQLGPFSVSFGRQTSSASCAG
jgi:hypothetical protein